MALLSIEYRQPPLGSRRLGFYSQSGDTKDFNLQLSSQAIVTGGKEV